MTSSQLTDYRTKAKPISMRFDDQQMTLLTKTFSTGSVGWYVNGKVKILCGDTYYPCQVSMTVTIIGSKNSHAQETAPEDQEGQEPVLLGPVYPYNEIVDPGSNGEVLEASGIETASHDAEQKMRKRPRKSKK